MNYKFNTIRSVVFFNSEKMELLKTLKNACYVVITLENSELQYAVINVSYANALRFMGQNVSSLYVKSLQDVKSPKSSIPYSFLKSIDEKFYANICAYLTKTGEDATKKNIERFLEFAINRVGYTPAMYRKVMTKGLIDVMGV